MSGRWVVKVGNRYWSPHAWTDFQWMAWAYATRVTARAGLKGIVAAGVLNARIVKLVAKGSKTKKSLEGRVAVLEAQVRSLQVALPKGVRHG